MAPSQRKKKAQKKQPPRSRPRMRSNINLDAQALAYARLLADPCNAPLVHPVYAGGDAGFLVRADSVLTVGNVTTETAGFLHWTPGYINSNNTELLIGAAPTATTATVATASSGGPAKGFLAANAKATRCVAACVTVTYPGSESSRSGRVHFGHTQASLIDSTLTYQPDQVAPLLQNFSRTPAESFEIFWKPGAADTEFNDPEEPASPLLRDRKSSITVSWAGLPVTTGLTFHFTAVYEWIPGVNRGVATNSNGKNRSANTLDQVLDTLIGRGFSFVRSAAHAAGGGLMAGGIAALSNTFGLMPAQTRARNTYRLM